MAVLDQMQVNEIQRGLERLKNSARSMKAETSTTTNPQSEFLKQHGLANFDCPICENKGYIWWRDHETDWDIHSKECECMEQRRAIRRMSDSGLADAVSRYSFNNYQTNDAETKSIKQKAKQFVSHGKCFLICGQSGSGKTHICTAICNELIKTGYGCKYFIWRKDAAELKSMVNSGEDFQKALNKLYNVPVLYIDDFLKGTISDADINIAGLIIDGRYRNPNGKTVISTELPINIIVEKDEALGGRIIEMSKGYILQAPSINWRTK